MSFQVKYLIVANYTDVEDVSPRQTEAIENHFRKKKCSATKKIVKIIVFLSQEKVKRDEKNTNEH